MRYLSKIWNKNQVPISPGLKRAIANGDRKHIHIAEQAYLLRLLSTPRGSDWLEIQNGISAHYQVDLLPSHTKQHIDQLIERGLVERIASGKFRIRLDCLDLCKEMLKDEQPKA